MAPSHSLLRSRVTRSGLRFESSSAVTEEVFECIFTEQSSICWVGGVKFFGHSVKSILTRYLGLRSFVIQEARSYSCKLNFRISGFHNLSY